MPLLRTNILLAEEFDDEGWMQAVNVREDKFRIYNSTLCPDIWDKNNQLDTEVRATLLKIAFDFYYDIDLKLQVQDVYLLGSAANYNWTPESDLDVHIIIDSAQLQMHPENAKKFFRSLVGKWNIEHEVKVKGHPVELYLQDVREPNAALGVFSLVQNQWIKLPTKQNLQIDKDSIQSKYSLWAEKINSAIRTEDEKKLKNIMDRLKDARNAGLRASGEFSTENLVFKLLRQRGYLEKLKTCYNDIYDKKMTVKNEENMSFPKPQNLLVQGFDPLSQGPNDIDPTGDNNGNYYKMQNKRMRNLEEEWKETPIKKSKLKQVQRKNFDNYLDLQLDRYTLEQLQSSKSKIIRFINHYMSKSEEADQKTVEILQNALEQIDIEMDSRLNYINNPVNEGYGDGNPEEDRLKIPVEDGSVRRWQIRSKDAPKTPKLPESIQNLVNEVLDQCLPLKEMPVISKTSSGVKAGDQPLKGMKLEDIKGNIVFFRNDKPSIFAAGFTLMYFMDSEESAQAMKEGKIPYLMVPRGTFHSGGSPITDIWKKRFQKPGTEHILGVIEGNTNDEIIYIDMVTVRPGYQRNRIATLMMDMIKQRFPNAKIETSSRTEKGEKLYKAYTSQNESVILMESPNQDKLKKNRRPLTDEEKKEVIQKGAVWEDGRPGVWKAVVDGKTWYVCNTHRAIQIKPTLKGAIKAFEFIKTTS